MKTARTVTVLTCAEALAVAVAAVVVAWPRLLAECHLQRLSSKDEATREHAALQLGSLGSLKAVPALLEATGSRTIRVQTAVEALTRIGRPCAPALAEALADWRGPVRRVAAGALLRLEVWRGHEAEGLFRNLVEGRSDQEAVLAFCELDEAPREAVLFLIGMLRDRASTLRRVAVEALACLGPRAAEALPALIEALEEDRQLTDEITLALVEVAPEDPRTLAALLGAPGSRGVIEALGKLGPRARAAVPRLAAALSSGGTQERRAAAEALGAVAAGDPSAIAALAAAALAGALQSGDSSVAYAAAAALARSGAAGVGPLIDVLEESDSVARMHAAWALGRIGARAREAVPALLRALGE
ncbi:MAG: HEAT repeat domain-containing protein [Planctomycetes bacterium]|nr:HEAT repeat domain-containing protein [Planctomycetota bacterium]